VIIGVQESERITPDEVVKRQKAARVSDLALEVRPTIPRMYLHGHEIAMSAQVRAE
jgi:hypothetical protein